MKPSTITVTLAPTANDAYIAANQTPGSASDLTLNGVGSTAKANTIAGTSITTCVLDTNANVRQIVITTASDESSKTISIYGRLSKSGPIVSEDITGPNATTAVSINYFYEVTRVAVSAAFTGNVKLGVNSVGASQAFPMNHWISPGQNLQKMIILLLTGTPNFTAQHTNGDVQNPDGSKVQWVDDSILAGVVTVGVFDSLFQGPAMAIRMKNNSGTGTGYLIVNQAGI